VAEPHAASGVGVGPAVGMFLGFGALFTLHFTMQTLVLAREGAMAVG
jgi:hypothetical protein